MRVFPTIALTGLCAQLACGGGETSQTGAATVVSSPPDTSHNGAEPAAANGPCSEAPDEIRPGATCLLGVRGKVRGEDDLAPSAPVALSLCGDGICVPGAVASDGSFDVLVGRHVRVSQFAVHIDGRPAFADVFVRLSPDATGEVVLTAAATLVALPNAGPLLPDSAVTAPRSFYSGGVSLELPANARLAFDLVDYDASARAFRAAASHARSVDGGFLQVHAFGPFGARSTAPMVVTVPLASPLPPGHVLSAWTLEDDVTTASAGKYAREGQAVVLADGLHARAEIGRLTYLALSEEP